MARRLALGTLLLTIAAILPVGTVPMRAASDNAPQIGSVTHSVFHLRPQLRRVDVIVDFVLTNRIPTRGGVRTYVDDRVLIVQKGARDMRVRGLGASLRPVEQLEMGTVHAVDFSRIFAGQSRRFRVSYQLPAAGPRSDNRTRITEAYSHFCWHGQPSDSATVVALVSSNYEPKTHIGKVRTKRTADGLKLTAMIPRGGDFYACTDSFNTGRLVQSETTAPGGQIVTIQGWREDPAWTTEVTNGIERSLARLEDLAGAPLPSRVVVRQVASQALGEYAGDFDAREGVIRVSERIDDPVVLAHELAHVWFNYQTMAETWMVEGHAEWLSHSAHGLWCQEKPTHPGQDKPRLADWKFLDLDATERAQQVVSYQYAAACTLMQEIEKTAGIDAVADLNASLLARTAKYGGTTNEDAPKPDWREWLDAADEVALVPSGQSDLSMAERMLLEEGIASPRQLRGRAEARARYHEAISGSHLDFMPIVVRDRMDAWKFDDAMKALTVAEEAMAMAETIDGLGSTTLVEQAAAQLASASTMDRVKEIRNGLKAKGA